MSRLPIRERQAFAWAGANFVPIVLVPLGGLLMWTALWRVWLPPIGSGGAVTRSVTTVNANAATKPTHRVTTVLKTSRGASPSRRSEALVLALLFLGAGAAVIGVFHDRIGSIELGKDGVKIDLSPAEKSGAAELVSRLVSSGADARTVGRGLQRYVRSVAARRPAPTLRAPASATRGRVAASGAGGLTAEDAAAIAGRIADELV